MPDVPTMQEAGFKDFNMVNWFGAWLPAGAPPEIVTRLHAEIVQALQEPDVQKEFDALGLRSVGIDAGGFRALRRQGVRRRPGDRPPDRRTQEMSDTAAMEPWQWPEARWRSIVDHVRAGRTLKPEAWKDGARCAVALSFDSDHETNELRDGGGSISKLSQGQYGNRKGVPRILDILGRHGVPASFFVPAVTALLYPDEQRRVVAEGHEIGIHGWIHERNSVLPLEAERDLQMRAADMLEKIAGVRPVGIRTPSWDFSPNTLAITRDMGLEYDSSHDGRRRLLRTAAGRRARPASSNCRWSGSATTRSTST